MFPCLGPSLSDVIKGLCHSSKLCVAPKQSAAVIFRQFFLPEGEETTLRMCLTTSFASFSGHLNGAANPEKIKRGILHIGFEAAWDSARRELERDWCVLFIIRQGIAKSQLRRKSLVPIWKFDKKFLQDLV